MEIAPLLPGPARVASAEDVVDAELAGAWVVDMRRPPRSAVRAGWLVELEDDIVALVDGPEAVAHPAWDQPLDAA